MQTIDFTKFALNPGDRVLDLGCGEGRHTIGAYIVGEVDAVGVDLSLRDIKIARERAQPFVDENNSSNRGLILSVANAMALPFADNSFDKVICSEVLEHIPDYQAVLEEIHRVLKPGGYFAASVPRAWPERICWALSDAYHQNEGGHIRIFNAQQLKADIELLGLRCYARHWAHALHVPFWWLKCLLWKNQHRSKLIQWYHKFLVWDLLDRPWLTRFLDQLLNPVMGKSVVMYFRKGLERNAPCLSQSS